MNYRLVYKIANEKNSRTKDEDYTRNSDKYYPDYDYTPKTMEKVLSTLPDDKKGVSGEKQKYLKDSVISLVDSESGTAIIDEIGQHIISYYRECFEPEDEEYKKSRDETVIELRCFFHVGSKEENGDYFKEKIRIFFKNFPEVMNSQIPYVSFSSKLVSLVEEYKYKNPTDWFHDYLRYVFAHEMFHLLQDRYYKIKNGMHMVGNRTVPKARAVMEEALAEYFATSYMHAYYLSKNPKGAGLDEALANKRWMLMDCKNKRAYDFGKNTGSIPELSDYAGGMLLYLIARDENEGKQGNGFSEYMDLYRMILRDEDDEARQKMVLMKERYFKM